MITPSGPSDPDHIGDGNKTPENKPRLAAFRLMAGRLTVNAIQSVAVTELLLLPGHIASHITSILCEMLLGIVALLIVRIEASDFDYARILGTPKMTCVEDGVMLDIETSLPFQGRIYVTDKNGSRVYSGFISIGFHPVVMTPSDRVFALRCLDEAPVREISDRSDVNCTHAVRQAAHWDRMPTNFTIGDPIVHDWSCQFPREEEGQFLTVLTYCSAVSRTGQVMHLIDENGCIVDQELLSDLTYSNYQVKIYGRAKMFRFVSGDKFRFECRLRMCRKGVGGCNSESIPPKCAFTKEEILKHKEGRRTRLDAVDQHFKTNLLNDAVSFAREISVSSEWIHVAHNDYTDAENLRERYRINGVVDHSMEPLARPIRAPHFLKYISYREVQPPMAATMRFLPVLATKLERFEKSKPTWRTTYIILPPGSTPSPDLFRETKGEDVLQLTLPSTGWQIAQTPRVALPFDDVPAGTTTTTRRPRKVVYRPNESEAREDDLELMDLNAGEPPFDADSAEINRIPGSVNDIQEQFENHRQQWRLDEVPVNQNETIILAGAQCSNSTTSGTSQRCKWSSMENILLAWSFGSLVLWIILGAVCFHRYNSKKPAWTRRRHMISAACVIPREHPWTHQDAFVEPKPAYHKKEIDLQHL
ncbi:unnamed protein product, partial [Mesorhabditis spiculigera]